MGSPSGLRQNTVAQQTLDVVGADLSANTAFQTLHFHRMYQLSRTSGTPPGPLPQKRFSSVVYRLFDKRRLAGDLPGTGSKACATA